MLTHKTPNRANPRTASTDAMRPLGTAAIAALWYATKPEPPKARVVQRFTVEPPPNWIGTQPGYPAISADGRFIAYSQRLAMGGRPELMLRALDSFDGETRVLKGTALGYAPFFSPNGEWIGYSAGHASEMRKVRVSGGAPIVVCKRPRDMTGTWGDDNNIYFGGPATGIHRVDASGGDAQVLTTPDAEKGERGHLVSQVLPGAGALLYTITGNASGAFRTAIRACRQPTGETLRRRDRRPVLDDQRRWIGTWRPRRERPNPRRRQLVRGTEQNRPSRGE